MPMLQVNSVLVSADPATCSDLHSDSKACQMNIEVPADERYLVKLYF